MLEPREKADLLKQVVTYIKNAIAKAISGDIATDISEAVATAIPSGVISQFAAAVAPAGYLLCDGSPVLKTAYPELWAAIGTTWDTKTNTATGSAYDVPAAGYFRLPDLRGVFTRGVGTPAVGTAATLGGYQTSELLAHSHNFIFKQDGVWYATHYLTSGTRATAVDTSYSNISPDISLVNAQTGASSSSGLYLANEATGGNETRPVNVGINYIIKV